MPCTMTKTMSKHTHTCNVAYYSPTYTTPSKLGGGQREVRWPVGLIEHMRTKFVVKIGKGCSSWRDQNNEVAGTEGVKGHP